MMPRRYELCLPMLVLLIKFILKAESTCLFDEVSLKDPIKLKSKSHIQSYLKPDTSRTKRSVPLSENYESIRIKVVLCGDDGLQRETEMERLQKVMGRTARFAEQLFSVVRHEGNLLLARSNDACPTTYQAGPNVGKCASVKDSYRGEFCIDNFMIPDEHLEGLAVYGPTDPEPTQVVRTEGSGVADTDFILYVRSMPSVKCVSPTSNVKAYASFCQLGENNRPVAGYINICPYVLADEHYNEHSLFLIALHELFHTLGFSKDMFGKFQQCDQDGCIDRTKSDTTSMIEGADRLVTPVAVQTTSSHFGCSTHTFANEFGPILETENGAVMSHWDGAFMYSSIMAPTIGLPFQTIVDNITLAFFQDMGWYQVNFTYAQNFPWGRDGGCRWGIHPNCISKAMIGDCFCDQPEEQGCHYLRKSKGVCKTDSFLHQCFTYKSVMEDSCLFPENSPNQDEISRTGEYFDAESRCFLANLTTDSPGTDVMKGRCYDTRCQGNDVEIRVGDSTWVPCPYGSYIQVPGYQGMLQCPEAGILCVENDRVLPFVFEESTVVPTTESIETVPPTSHPPEEETGTVTLDITFPSASYDYLEGSDQIGFFMEECDALIRQLAGLPVRRIQNPLLRRGSVIFRFDLLPAQYSGDGPPTRLVIDELSRIIDNGGFTINLQQDGSSYTASRVARVEAQRRSSSPSVVSDSGMRTEVIVGVVVGSIIAALLIGVAVYFVQRFYAVQSQRSAHRSHSQGTRSSGDGDSRNSSQSRASGWSRVSMRSRRSSNHTVSMMLGAGVDLDQEGQGPGQQQQQQHPGVQQEKIPVSIMKSSSSEQLVAASPTEERQIAEGASAASSEDILPVTPSSTNANQTQSPNRPTHLPPSGHPSLSSGLPSPSSPHSANIAQGLPPIAPTAAPKTPDVSYDHRTERTPDGGAGGRGSKPPSRQRTPVSADRNARRSSIAQSSTSRASSGDRQPSSKGSSDGRRRSRSRSRGSIKTRENSPYGPSGGAHNSRARERSPTAPIRKQPSRRSQSTRSQEKPRVQIREPHTSYAYDHEDMYRGYYSPRAPRAIISKSQIPSRNNSQVGSNPKMRRPRPREQRRKTTQCVFSPRDLVTTESIAIDSPTKSNAHQNGQSTHVLTGAGALTGANAPTGGRRGFIPMSRSRSHGAIIGISHGYDSSLSAMALKSTAVPQGTSPPKGSTAAPKSTSAAKCLDVDSSTSTQCQQQQSPCPLQYKNKKPYESTACPLQTPNCSKEDIKECDLPPPVINPRDSDLSFTVDLKDIEIESLSVYNAPRPELQKMNAPSSNKSPRDPQKTRTSSATVNSHSKAVNNAEQSSHSSKSQSQAYQSTQQAPTFIQNTSPPTKPIHNTSSKPPAHPHTNGYRNNVPQQQQHQQPSISSVYSTGAGPHVTNLSIEDEKSPPTHSQQPVVEHLEQLPVIVPIIQLSARDMQALQQRASGASGSWRSFSSDTSLDSMSSPV